MANSCPGSTFNVDVTVNAEPADKTVSAVKPSLCVGELTQIQLSSSVSGFTYQLRNDAGNVNVGSPVLGTGGTINFSTGVLSSTTTYNVLATNNTSGCYAEMSTLVTVSVNPLPSVSLIRSPTTICEGSSSLLTATNSGGTAGPVSGSNNTTYSGNGNDPQTINSSITLPNGILSSLSDITLTMNATHTWAGDVKATLTSPCGTTTIFDRPGGSNNGNDFISSGDYVFTTTSGNTFPGSSSSTIPTGTYKATFAGISVAPACSSIGGTWTLTLSTTSSSGHDRTITLNNWSISISSGSGYTTVFNGPTTIGSTSYSGTGNTTATANVTPAVGTNNYTATTTDALGCSNTSSSVSVTVNQAATVTTGGPDNVCQSASPSAITLTGSSVGGGATTGAWSIVSGGGSLSSTIQTANPATVTYTPAANYSGTVTLRLTTNTPSGCSAVNDTRTVNVSALPTVTRRGN
ncbi:MAG: proprotein convertase P-domain-containing protein [Bacteroidetes bacterium]|nr:proprotein convertase P-domain-containing protein [Bacteroidota bacterium]